MGGSLTDAFQSSAACKFLDLPPVSLRNLQTTPDYNSPRHTSTQLCGISLRKYRIIEWCSNEMNFSRMQTAKTEGYLEGNRGFCRQQTAEIQPLMCREHCAVFP
jgi:hypothetical protein